ncbi:dolichol kinase [Cardiosporidium cionae]|uniref:dolichol kinase n=1 Tax=Cardiosporidium cionae TaxID=476202 RepID=A0ABQ7JG50_9APIC|nr:dolichol kinase [Cardiosporidium cionae]|eukprot:KAF8823007.1 dolichol kinase [Cardiosporidium cionae]
MTDHTPKLVAASECLKGRIMAINEETLPHEPMALLLGSYACAERGISAEVHDIYKLFERLYSICYYEGFQFTTEQLEDFFQNHHSIFAGNDADDFLSISEGHARRNIQILDSSVSTENAIRTKSGKGWVIKCDHATSHSYPSCCIVTAMFHSFTVRYKRVLSDNHVLLEDAAMTLPQQLKISKEPIRINGVIYLKEVYKLFVDATSMVKKQLEANNSSLLTPIVLIHLNFPDLSANVTNHHVMPLLRLSFHDLSSPTSNSPAANDGCNFNIFWSGILLVQEYFWILTILIGYIPHLRSFFFQNAIAFVFSFGYSFYILDAAKIASLLDPVVQVIVKLNIYLVIVMASLYVILVVIKLSGRIKAFLVYITPALGFFYFLHDRIYDSDTSNVRILNWLIFLVFGRRKTLLLLILWLIITVTWVINLFHRSSKQISNSFPQSSKINFIDEEWSSTFQQVKYSSKLDKVEDIQENLNSERIRNAMKKDRRYNLMRRKEFHFLISINVILAVVFKEIELLCLALSGVLGLFLLLEFFRYSEINSTISVALNNFAYRFIDSRDQQGIIHTHIFLLLGVGLPVLYEFISIKKDSFNLMRALIGMFVVGIGDAMAAIVGTNWGKKKMPLCNRKTIAGSAAFFCSTFGALFVANHFLSFCSSTSTLATLTISSALFEAYTQDLDNLHLPLYASAVLRALSR